MNDSDVFDIWKAILPVPLGMTFGNLRFQNPNMWPFITKSDYFSPESDHSPQAGTTCGASSQADFLEFGLQNAYVEILATFATKMP